MMAVLGVSGLMRCCVCVSAKRTVSLGSVKSTGVDSCAPLIMAGNGHWPGIEQGSILRAFPKNHVIKGQIELAVLLADCRIMAEVQSPAKTKTFTMGQGSLHTLSVYTNATG